MKLKQIKLNLIALSLTSFLCSPSWAALDDNVSITGRIGRVIASERVIVHDQFDQTFYLQKKSFPANFKFEQGRSFNIEIPAREFEEIKLIKGYKPL